MSIFEAQTDQLQSYPHFHVQKCVAVDELTVLGGKST